MKVGKLVLTVGARVSHSYGQGLLARLAIEFLLVQLLVWSASLTWSILSIWSISFSEPDRQEKPDEPEKRSHFLTGRRQNGHCVGGWSVRYRRQQEGHVHMDCPLGGFIPVGTGGLFSSAIMFSFEGIGRVHARAS